MVVTGRSGDSYGCTWLSLLLLLLVVQRVHQTAVASHQLGEQRQLRGVWWVLGLLLSTPEVTITSRQGVMKCSVRTHSMETRKRLQTTSVRAARRLV